MILTRVRVYGCRTLKKKNSNDELIDYVSTPVATDV
jgi:hypothetical protein